MDPLQVRCRRVAIDEYLDGDTQRVRCADDEEACDWCMQQQASPPADQQPVHESIPQPIQESVRQPIQESIQQPAPAPPIPQSIPPSQRTIPAVDTSSSRLEFQAQDQQRTIPQARRVQQAQSRANTQAQVQRQLERWKGVCVICKARGREYHYSISQCTETNVGEAERERKRWQG